MHDFERTIVILLATHGPSTGRTVMERLPASAATDPRLWACVDDETRLRWTLRSLCDLRDVGRAEVVHAVLPDTGWENPESVWRLTPTKINTEENRS